MAEEPIVGGDLEVADPETEGRPVEQPEPTAELTTEPTAEPTTEPQKREWWKELKGVQGIDSEEKAIDWAVKGQEGIQRAFNENAQLKRSLQLLQQEISGLRKPSTPAQTLKWTDLLLKHTKQDASGNVVTDYDAAWQEGMALQGETLMQKFQAQNIMTQETDRASRELETLSKQGLIPDYVPTIVDEASNQILQEGSDFGKEVHGYKLWAKDEFDKVPFNQHPHRDYLLAVYALGMRHIAEQRKKTSEKVKAIASAGGGRTVQTSSGKTPLEMTDKEIIAENERLKMGV